MWKQYQKTLIPMLIFSIVICAFLYSTGRTSAGGTVIVFLSMQVANVLGAWWAARIKRQIERGGDRLPLE